jgi:uncharacterized protein DUF2721
VKSNRGRTPYAFGYTVRHSIVSSNWPGYGPCILLGAVAAFTSVLISRMNRIIDRLQALHAIRDDDASKAHLKLDIPRLKRRAALLNSATVLTNERNHHVVAGDSGIRVRILQHAAKYALCFLSSLSGSLPYLWYISRARHASRSTSSTTIAR